MVMFMQFRKHGARVQCLRSRYCKEKGYGVNDQIFSFSIATTNIEGIDALLLNKLTEDEIRELREHLSEDEGFLAKLVDDIDTCQFKFTRKSVRDKFNKTEIVSELYDSLMDLKKTIWRLKE